MKNLKYVKTFESFKINEEVPYDFSAGKEMTTVRWTDEERADLERLGADSIETNTATFVEDRTHGSGFVVTVSKHVPSLQSNIYKIESDRTPTVDFFNKSGSNTWDGFLRALDRFIKDGGGLIVRPQRKYHE